MRLDMVTRSLGDYQIMKKDLWIPEDLMAKVRQFNPKTELGKIVKEVLKYIPDPEMANELIARVTRTIVAESELRVKVVRRYDSAFLMGRDFIEDWGVVSRNVVTTTGVEKLTDAFQSTSATMYLYAYHALGTSSGAEAVGNTALGGEITTNQYTSGTRSSGTNTEDSASVWKTVATNTIASGPVTVVEHGVFNSATPSTGNLWDRSLTGTQVLSTGDSLQTDYRLTITAGG